MMATTTRMMSRMSAAAPCSSTSRSQLHLKTPLVRSDPLSRVAGVDVLLKLDNLQPCGSFKLRGIGRRVRLAVEEGGATHLISSSGGNAGLATAYAGRAMGVPVTVVVPTTTPAFVMDLLGAYGATALQVGSVWDEAHAHATGLAEKEDLGGGTAALIHPFEHEDTWTGHATIVHEVRDQMVEMGYSPDTRPSSFVTVVGGGGLLQGILQGLSEVGWDRGEDGKEGGGGGGGVRVLACETEGASSMAQSLASGSLVTLPAVTSIAKSLGAATVSREVFEHCRALGTDRVASFVTTDREAVRACARFADEHRMLVEPACAVGLAAVYGGAAAAAAASARGGSGGGDGPMVVEVCGGALVTREMLDGWCATLGVDETWV